MVDNEDDGFVVVGEGPAVVVEESDEGAENDDGSENGDSVDEDKLNPGLNLLTGTKKFKYLKKKPSRNRCVKRGITAGV